MKDVSHLAYDFMQNLKKGDVFVVGEKIFSVKAKGKWNWEGVRKNLDTLTLTCGDVSIKFYNYLSHGWDGSPRGNKKDSSAKQHNFLRDIEGVLIVDALNVYNPFHEQSDVLKIALREK